MTERSKSCGGPDAALSRVLLVHGEADSRKSWRDKLNALPGIEVVREAGDAHQALSALPALAPDVAVVDLALPGMNGIELTREMVRRQPKIAVIISSGFGISWLAESFRAGARCYLPCDSVGDLGQAVQCAVRGRCHFTDQTRSALTDMLLEEYVFRLQRREAAGRYSALTAREREVLHRLISGKTNKEVACDLDLSVHTVDTHRARILQKLNVHSVAELTKYVLFSQELESDTPLGVEE